jgi:acetyl-CoA carboxylase/biotin carboxylase 1
MISSRSSTQVSLKAREVLILVQMPSFEERFVQMESILKASLASNFHGSSGGDRSVLLPTSLYRH